MELKRGSSGSEVTRIQARLGIDQTSKFGPKTEAAVRAWQSANGFTPNGIVNRAVWDKLFEEPAATRPAAVQAAQPVLNIDKLKGHIPDSVLAQIPDTAARFNITTNLRLAHFLAQCAHESGGFRAVTENLNYSAQGLKKTFPKYFPGALNESYARQPERIANRVYSSRMGNGDEKSGEGWRFRGRGYIQLTGKSNYAAFDKFVEDDILANPDLVATKYPLASAAFFFNNNKLWSICDRGSTDEVVTLVTRRVNGGTIGLVDRLKHFKEYWALLK